MRSAIISVGLIVLVGCFALNVSHSNAQEDNVTVTKAWEYKLVSLMKLASGADTADADAMAKSIEAELNTLGTDGWELSLNVHNGLILKRPK